MTGRVLLPATDWRARRRAAERQPPAPAPRRDDRIEFEETEPAGQDGGWTVGYLDVLLLLVTLFAALLGTTYLQMGELRGPRAEAFNVPDKAEVAHATPLPAPGVVPAADAEPESTVDEVPETTTPGVAAPANQTKPGPDTLGVGGIRIGSAAGVPDETVSETAAEVDYAGADPAQNPSPVAQAPAAVVAEPTGPPPDQVASAPAQFQPMLDLVGALGEQQGLELLLDRQELRLEVGDGILFPSGTAELADAGRALISELVTALDDERLHISVEGHTDDVPIHTARYPSNWELSSIRATTVAQELFAQGIPQHRVRVTGFADTRPRAPNDSAGNRALNRRVSLVLEMREDLLAQALPERDG